MRIHWLQHVAYEGLGALAPLLEARAETLTRTRLFVGEALPAPGEVDLLVVLGGPMSVNDEATLPWLAAEKTFLREILALDKPVLGICLGAQLIASALGAPVGPSPEREVGWWPVEDVPPPTGRQDPPRFRFPPVHDFLQWHGETFGLPSGAAHLARSRGCEHQALQVGRRAIGVQFHPEADPDWVRTVLAHSPESLRPGRYVMAENALLTDLEDRCRAGNLVLGALMDFIIQ